MILSVIASIIYVLLNSISIWLIGTMLANVMGGNSLSIVNPTTLNEHLNFFIQNLIGRGQQIDQLKMLCILLTIIFISKNILFYTSNLIMAYVQNNVITERLLQIRDQCAAWADGEPSSEPMDPCDPAHPAYDEVSCGGHVEDTAAGGPSDPCDPAHPAYDPADPACMDTDTGEPPSDTGDPSCSAPGDGQDGPMDPCDPASPDFYEGNPGCVDAADWLTTLLDDRDGNAFGGLYLQAMGALAKLGTAARPALEGVRGPGRDQAERLLARLKAD